MESMRWVGVDVHAKESVAAVLDQATGEISTHRIAGRPEVVLDWLATVAQRFRAGPLQQRRWQATAFDGSQRHRANTIREI